MLNAIIPCVNNFECTTFAAKQNKVILLTRVTLMTYGDHIKVKSKYLFRIIRIACEFLV
jgi:hypothetical protein